MNPLKQYLDLYEANAELVNAGGAPVLNALRDSAAEALRNTVLPCKGRDRKSVV